MKASNKFLFDMRSVEAIEPGEKERIAWDEEVEGFGLRVLPSGTRSWIASRRVRGEDGKVRRRRVTIGRFEDVGLEEARKEARRVLSGSEEAAGAVQEEDVGAPAEGATAGMPQDMKDAGEGAVWVNPDDDVEPREAEHFHPETGEILSGFGGEDDGGWVDEGLDLDDLSRSAAAGERVAAREEEAGPDRVAMADVLGGVLQGVDGDGRERREGGTGRGEGPELGADESEHEGIVSEAADVTDGDSSKSPVGDDGSVRSGPGVGAEMVRKVGGAVATVAGQAARLGRKARTDRGNGSEPEDEAASRPAEVADVHDAGIEEVPPPARLVKRQRRGEGTEGGNREGMEVSDETAAGVARNLDEAGGLLDRIAETGEKLMPLLEDVSSSLTLFSKDVRNWRRRWVGPVVVLVVLAPVLVGAGLLIQSRFPLLPRADPTGGWKDHVWEQYGPALVECYRRAQATEAGRTDCAVEVRAR